MYYRLAETPTPFAKELVALLDKKLRELPDTLQDYAALEEFRHTKKPCA
jgi:hypothetical protein